MNSKTISVSIVASPQKVYDFASNLENLPKWVPSFAKSVARSDAGWIVESPDGPVDFHFIEHNTFGVLDHTVILSSGLEIYNPMRVIANGSGSEVIFTLFQTSDMSEEQFAEEAKFVKSDLHTSSELRRVVPLDKVFWPTALGAKDANMSSMMAAV